jgi:hypothetical protein
LRKLSSLPMRVMKRQARGRSKISRKPENNSKK